MVHSESSKCVLVVDDDPRSLKLMSIVLGKAGYRVLTAGDGARGLERLVAERPDLVIVDLLMPGMDGLEFCRNFRQLPGLGTRPLAMLTAMASDEVRRQACQAGADAVFVKPFERLELLAELARLLERSAAAPTERDCSGQGQGH